MTELKPDDREALIRALETGRVRSMTRLIELGLIYIGPHPTIEGESKLQLTPAGHLLAVELRKSDRLERAKQKLREWGPTVGQGAWLEWVLADGAWTVYMKWSSDFRGEPGEACFRDFDPLTAVIEASKQTPWELEE